LRNAPVLITLSAAMILMKNLILLFATGILAAC
jgi:hypothetical protein